MIAPVAGEGLGLRIEAVETAPPGSHPELPGTVLPDVHASVVAEAAGVVGVVLVAGKGIRIRVKLV